MNSNYIDDKGLIDYFNNNKQANFIASCISPWHALGVESCIRRLKINGIDVSGIIIINPHQNRYVISKDNFSENVLRKCNIFKYQRSSSIGVRAIINYLVSNNRRSRSIYFAGNMAPNVHISSVLCTACNFKVITRIIDEGIGSYTLDSSFSIQWAITEKGNMSLKEKLLFSVKEMVSHQIYKYIMGWKQNSYEMIFKKEKGKLLENTKIIESYKFVLTENAKRITDKFDYYSNSIIFATQPYVEDGMALEEEYLSIVTDVIEYYKQLGKKVIIRLHPRETEKKYEQFNCLIEKSKYSLEAIMASLDILPDAIVAFNSTVLVTCSLFWNIKAYSVGNLLISRSKNLPDANKENINRFFAIFGNYVNELF